MSSHLTEQPPNLGLLLLHAFRWFDEALLRRLAAGGWPDLTSSHSLVFPNLDPAGTRPAELARRLGVTRQAAHQTVHDLVGMGMVELVPDPDDRRAKLIQITVEGWRSIRFALGVLGELEAELEHRIGSVNVRRLREALEGGWGASPQ